MTPQILVLDDQVQYGRSLERALRQDYDLVLATTMAEAIEKMSADFSLVLSDIRLDESNPVDRQGLEFIRWVRARDQKLPIVAMSAVDESSLEQDALVAGATKFLRKPIVISQLRTLLQELLRKEY